MKTELKDRRSVLFINLKPGDTFAFCGGHAYMKTVFVDHEDCINCVDLNTGMFYYVKDYEYVEPLNLKVVEED